MTKEIHSDESHPTLIDANRGEDVELQRRQGATVLDTIEMQLAELVETRRADKKLSAAERAEEIARILSGRPLESYGTWAFYPWTNRLVHVLPEAEFFELRTSRNRNKITKREQVLLGSLTMGIAGLSVGQATALTLALEGVGGTLRLADFDTLSLSNMNRLRAGVHEIGLRKTSIVARAIYELNPYAKLELFDDGITDQNIDRFMDSLDFLFEECDDLKMKVRLREEARRRKIPVLMETSDRGMIDVERFDLEPDRPLFHGLAGDLNAASLAGLSTYEKVPIVLSIVGAQTMSRRAAASLIDIDATLKTWPQLASAVALGSAVNTDVARRIALGKLHSSGRFFVDLEDIVRDRVAEPAAKTLPHQRDTIQTPTPDPPASPARRVTTGSIASEKIERLVELASLAPSGGNCQPWRFRLRDHTLSCIHDVARSRTLLDFEHRATYAAFGALAENLRLGAAALGLGIEIRPFPSPDDPLVVCEATLGGKPVPLSPEEAKLLEQIELRVTNRKLSQRTPLANDVADALTELAKNSGANLCLATSNADLDALGDVLGMGDRLRLMSPVMHHEMMGELRWSKHDAVKTRDGLDLATLELTATDEAAMRLLADWSVMEAVREVDGGHGLAQPAKKSIAGASAVGLIAVPRDAHVDTRSAYFNGGIAMQRVWLAASMKGYAFQPMTALPYLFARLEDGHGIDLDDREKRELQILRTRYRSIFKLDANKPVAEVMLFRLANAAPPTARSLRRSLDDILDYV